MLRAHHRFFDRCIKALDLVLIGIAVWFGAWMQSDSASITWPMMKQTATIAAVWFLVALRSRFYQSRRTSELTRELADLTESWLIAFAVGTVLVMLLFTKTVYEPVSTFLGALGTIGLLRLPIRSFLRRIRVQGLNTRRLLLVGRGRMTHRLARTIREHPEFGLLVKGSFFFEGETGDPPEGVECLGDSSQLAKVIAGLEADSVVLCPDLRVSQSDVQSVLDKCDIAGIQCSFVPDFLSLNNLRATSSLFGDIPTFRFQPHLGAPRKLAIKRAIDIVGALTGIIITSPILIAVAIAIKFSDRGPLLFRQVRLGKDGRPFNCLKFRSMCVDAEEKKAALVALNEQDGPAFKMSDDPRVTKVGKVIRKYSLDELPQLFNVLSGDMSLVGPRPPVPSEVGRYSWWQRRRISVRPGLTCVWQVKGRNRVSFDQWMEMDLFYIDNWTLWMDIKLMMQTLPALMRGTGS